ncbi:small-conductance mechanosensitive channel [Halobacteroides halobius DSM 5150]|uniref:Small-conductance mechanosensitive channel n=1 Tax=Halobacteroides halobius (strain ATCC 35273 / DSM 5150 / MD-1) TaxID=748449 RepID=L0KD65_HALHC|nr:mechanosensitive ion channel family protein [Halobacteroides halobius]AGB42485.1 small-conductance mechanosensitive channel [Halobacteroides halobius DSM 5150]
MEELVEWLARFFSPNLLIKIGLALLQLVGILITTKLLLRFGYFFLERLFKGKNKSDKYIRQRNKTLNSILKSALRYILYFIGGTMALEVLGVPTTSIIAGAGVVGVAVGFGAQSLVKDIITGFFILFEKQFVLGDYIKIAGQEGFVEEIGLRVTKIKDFDGIIHNIPNGSIKQVTNLTASARRVVVDVAIDYQQNIQEAITILDELCQEVKEEHTNIIKDGPTVLGVQELAASSVNLRITAMVDPFQIWEMERIIKQQVKEHFDEREIEIPYKHLTIVKKSEELV